MNNTATPRLGSAFAQKNAPKSKSKPLHVPGITDEQGFGVIKSKEDLRKLLESTEGQIVEINDPNNVLGMKEELEAMKIKETSKVAKPGAIGGGGDILVDTSDEAGEKEKAKPHMGFLPAVTVVALMAMAEAFYLFRPEIWKQACTVNIPTLPAGTAFPLDFRLLLTSTFAAPSFQDWIINSYVAFFSIRTLSMIFGNTVGFGFIAMYFAYANRVLLFEATRSHAQYVEEIDSDGNKSGEIAYFTQPINNSSANTTMIFGIAAFAGCMLPNVMLPWIPQFGSIPLLALSTIGVLYDLSFAIKRV